MAVAFYFKEWGCFCFR